MQTVPTVHGVRALRTVVMVLTLASAGRVVRAQQPSDVCVSTIPPNVQPGLLAQNVNALIHASPTFRAQCERIAAERPLRVDLDLVLTLGAPRAETTFTRYRGVLIRASVRISFGHDYRELIAHEFEHVIEQLDGVDLLSEVGHGRAWLVDDRAFETKRASEAGRRVRRECERSAARPAVEAQHGLR